MNNIEFKEWPKIPRGQHEKMTITEKIDGTNGCVVIHKGEIVGVQSRKRFITPENDNYGFASWVKENESELLSLGDGYHYGEWAGLGIQKNPHNLDAKHFFLFNTFRWGRHNPDTPKCCKVVPVLFEGDAIRENIDLTLEDLLESSDHTPEGVIVYYHNTRRYEKYTYRDTRGKWLNAT